MARKAKMKRSRKLVAWVGLKKTLCMAMTAQCYEDYLLSGRAVGALEETKCDRFERKSIAS
jgi:hypothetical protein